MKCFTASIEARSAFHHHPLSYAEFDDHLAVARLAARKDSLAILYILGENFASFAQKLFSPLSRMEEGIKGYRDEALTIAADVCRKLERSAPYCFV
jgi:hypothetical protein